MAEFAIALPLLILVMYGLANVGAKIFELGKTQLADYALETEAQYVMEKITHELRAAKEIKVEKYTDEVHKLKVVYHVVEDDTIGKFHTFKDADGKKYYSFEDNDVWETQFFIPSNKKLYPKRTDSKPTLPITGDNFFGETQINILRYSKLNENVLRIELELESLETEHKIRLATAVFMPGCKKFEVPPDE